MPIACLPECTLLFPVFMAGGEIYDRDKMQTLRERLQAMASYRRFENIKTVLDVLEEVWDVRTRTLPIDASNPYDWHHVLKRRGWKLALS